MGFADYQESLQHSTSSSELGVCALATATKKLQHDTEKTQGANTPTREYKMECVCFTQCLEFGGAKHLLCPIC